MQKATVIYSGFSPLKVEERIALTEEDTLHAAVLVGDALKKLGYRVTIQEINPLSIERQISKLNSDLVFNLCEWSGRDYGLGVRVIEILEERKIAFTGASSDNYVWGSEKELMKKMFEKFSIPTPQWFSYKGGKIIVPKKFTFPAIVKPAWEHCAIGISQESVVWDSPALEFKLKKMWRRFKQPILVEEFIDGMEYQITVLESNGKPWVLPPAEIVYKKDKNFLPILTFEGKWEENSNESEMSLIRNYSDGKTALSQMYKFAALAFTKMRCRGYIRLDVRERDGQLYFLEVNVNPGIDYNPEYGMTISSEAAGLSFENMIATIVSSSSAVKISAKSQKHVKLSAYI